MSDKDLTQEELNEMSYRELLEIAKKRGTENADSLSLKQLRVQLGAAPDYAVVRDLGAGLSEKEIDRRNARGMRVPGHVIYNKDDEEAIWKVWEKNPHAFDGMDLTDMSRDVIHMFKRGGVIKCICGEKFKMEREWTDPKTRALKSEPVDIKFCKCGRKYIYINPDKVPEVAK